MAIPYWIWVGNTDTPQVEWKTFEKNLSRIIEARGGFANCPTPTLVETLRDLCQQSATLWKNTSVVIEKPAEDVVFICEVGELSAIVTFQPTVLSDGDVIKSGTADSSSALKCRADGRVQSSPSFTFNMAGWLTRIDFIASAGGRQSVPVQNCRAKLKRAEKLNPIPETREELLMKLPRLNGDPEDVYGANQACLDYDVAARWKGLRKKYQR